MTVEQLPLQDALSRSGSRELKCCGTTAKRRRGGIEIGALLPAVLARLGVNSTEVTEPEATLKKQNTDTNLKSGIGPELV